MTTPQDRVDAIKAKLDAEYASNPTFEVGTNPILEAVAAKMEENAKINSLAGVQAVDEDAAFQQAARSFLGCKPPKDLGLRISASAARKPMSLRGPVQPLPAEYDAVAAGLVPAIRSQASCGSCWDFSGLAAAESAAIKAGLVTNAVDWSEQDILDCGQNGGCNGDWPETAIRFLIDHGAVNESECRYKATSGSGRCATGPKKFIKSCEYVGSSQSVPSVDLIKQAVLDHGAVAVAVAVDNAWMAYKSGIFQGGYQGINHAVNIVGWKTDSQGRTVWRVRNSWGTTWGENGYMWTYAAANLIGYGAMYAEAIQSPTPVPPVPPGPTPPPVPPVPPGPTPPVLPSYKGTLKGWFPVGFNRVQEVELTGVFTPVQNSEFRVSEPVAMPGLTAIWDDLMAILDAWRSNNINALVEAMAKLLADLGIGDAFDTGNAFVLKRGQCQFDIKKIWSIFPVVERIYGLVAAGVGPELVEAVDDLVKLLGLDGIFCCKQ